MVGVNGGNSQCGTTGSTTGSTTTTLARSMYLRGNWNTFRHSYAERNLGRRLPVPGLRAWLRPLLLLYPDPGRGGHRRPHLHRGHLPLCQTGERYLRRRPAREQRHRQRQHRLPDRRHPGRGRLHHRSHHLQRGHRWLLYPDGQRSRADHRHSRRLRPVPRGFGRHLRQGN